MHEIHVGICKFSRAIRQTYGSRVAQISNSYQLTTHFCAPKGLAILVLIDLPYLSSEPFEQLCTVPRKVELEDGEKCENAGEKGPMQRADIEENCIKDGLADEALTIAHCKNIPD